MSSAKREDNREVALVLENLLATSTIFPTGTTLTNARPMHVAVVDGTGTQVTSFGGASAAVGATGAGVPASADYIGASKAGTLTGLLLGSQTGANSLATVLASDQVLSVRLQDGTGTQITSSTQALDINLKTSSITLPVSLTTLPALVAGTAVIGKVSIDQTTPGTTNLVALAANQSVNVAQINGVTPLMGAGASGTGAQRIVQANDSGKTLVSKGGNAASSGNNTLVVAGTNRLKVYAFSLSTISTIAVTCIFQSGASGTELWRVTLQTPASVAGGANLVVQPPAWLFATASATLLNLNLSAAVSVDYSISYFDEA